nr:AAA family ATPase [Roseobacter litoralis]
MPQPKPAPILACTISRDVQNFDLLIEEMELALGESWGDLGFSEALAYIAQPEAQALQFIVLAIDGMDEGDLELILQLLEQGKSQGLKVILITQEVEPTALHVLLAKGVDAFLPYPLEDDQLRQAIERVHTTHLPQAPVDTAPRLKQSDPKEGAVIAVHGLAGGTGATTLCVNLAWELANAGSGRRKEDGPSVCLLDLDLQYGAVATCLDLPRREGVYDMLSDTEAMDDEIFAQSLQTYDDRLQVLTAPAEMLPLDLMSSQDLQRILSMARKHFDYVVVDMPSTLVGWSEAVLHEAHVYLATLELDMRSAQNALRFKRALQAEDLPAEKLRYVMNRAPKFTDLSGKSRLKRMAEGLDISIDLLMPDGGKPITQGADHGLPLAQSAPKNPLRREILKLAQSLHELNSSSAEAA